MIFDKGTLVLDRYRISGIIDRGGTGIVYRARDVQSDCDVAIKHLELKFSLDPRIHERFRSEGLMMQQLIHPNIVRLYSFYESSNSSNTGFFLVMEYVPGGTLEDLIRTCPQIPLRQTAKIMRDILCGLHEAHSQGIIHRDIKPGNILMDSDGKTAKLSDFGIAHMPRLALTTLMQPGTLLWLSPEQALNRDVDARSDIYSAGVVLYQMLTGGRHYLDLERRIEEAKNCDPTRAIQQAIIHDRPVEPSFYRKDIPPGLDLIVMKCLEKRTRDRYQRVADLIADLDSFIRSYEEGTVDSFSAQPQKLKFPPAGLLPRFWAGVVDILLMLIILAGAALLVALFCETLVGPDYNERLIALALLPALLFYPLFWGFWRKTPGMRLLGLCLTDRDNRSPGKGRAVLRFLIYLVYLATLGILFFQVLADKNRLGFYDTLTGIYSVRSGYTRP